MDLISFKRIELHAASLVNLFIFTSKFQYYFILLILKNVNERHLRNLQEKMMVLIKNCDERKNPTIIWNYYKIAPKNNILRYYLPIWFDSLIFAASIERTWQP